MDKIPGVSKSSISLFILIQFKSFVTPGIFPTLTAFLPTNLLINVDSENPEIFIEKIKEIIDKIKHNDIEIKDFERFKKLYLSRAIRRFNSLEYIANSMVEADFDNLKRYCIDNNVQIDDNYDILYFDIETDDTNIGINIGATRILSFGAIDQKNNEFYFN